MGSKGVMRKTWLSVSPGPKNKKYVLSCTFNPVRFAVNIVDFTGSEMFESAKTSR